MTVNFRQLAREALARAKEEMASGSDARLHYAALELRMAIECVTYERARSYEKELQPTEYDTWQPGKLMKELLEIDPDADTSGTLSFGIEDVPGEHAKEMKTLGAEKVFNLAAIKKSYDALGSYLHQPTLRQLSKGGHDLPKARLKFEHIASQLEEVLSSPIFNINFGNFTSFQCMNDDCARQIRKRLPRGAQTVIAECFDCSAEHEVTVDGDGKCSVRPLVQDVKCANLSCGHALKLFNHEIRPGAYWACQGCATRNQIGLTVFDVSHADNKESS